MEQLNYPFDSAFILKKKRKIKKELLATDQNWLEKKIAVLGGSTTHDIVQVLDLFLLNHGIKASFYECEYNQYWQNAMFPDETLTSFNPDIFLIHTSFRNLSDIPNVFDNTKQVDQKLEHQFDHFKTMWESLHEKFSSATIIQNNIERPHYRLLGNKDISDYRGLTNYIQRLNQKMYNYVNSCDNILIHDLDYCASNYGLDKWHDLSNWYMYKYAFAINAIPNYCYNLSRIIKSIYGKNKKSLVLDLDNTLWGGIVGDDGVEGIQIGEETAFAEAYKEFQSYVKYHKDLGVILNVCSKNQHENAIAGLNHPDGVLHPDDFVSIKANWNPKDQNILDIASELNLGVDSFVFVDDNPAEREIVKSQINDIAVPDMDKVEEYIKTLDGCGYFELTQFSKDDVKRNEMYKQNAQRTIYKKKFTNYHAYLESLIMKADIKNFESLYYSRIAQLTNKSNQFNLTTRRFSESDIIAISKDKDYICLYGKLTDKFGDNGVVSIVIGKQKGKELHLNLWLMSCRVLKRNMEHAMLDTLVNKCKTRGITKVFGYYYPTAKNAMVKDFYGEMGFENTDHHLDNSSAWCYDLQDYIEKNHVIEVTTD